MYRGVPSFDDTFKRVTSNLNSLCPLIEDTPENNVNYPNISIILIEFIHKIPLILFFVRKRKNCASKSTAQQNPTVVMDFIKTQTLARDMVVHSNA